VHPRAKVSAQEVLDKKVPTFLLRMSKKIQCRSRRLSFLKKYRNTLSLYKVGGSDSPRLNCCALGKQERFTISINTGVGRIFSRGTIVDTPGGV